jgi:hypothetical protein
MIRHAAFRGVRAAITRSRTLLLNGLLCGVVLLSLSACTAATIKYRLTLQVEVDGVVHEGSSVIETEWTHYPKWLQMMTSPWRVEVHGEAVVVDLGSRGLLFALLTGPARYDHGHHLRVDPTDPAAILSNFHFTGREGITHESLDGLSRRRDVIDVPFSDLPELVRFGDIRNPGSMDQVNPDELDVKFGPGVKLVRATLAITNAPISSGIETRLTWLNGLRKHERDFADGGPLAPLGVTAFKK